MRHLGAVWAFSLAAAAPALGPRSASDARAEPGACLDRIVFGPVETLRGLAR